MYNIICSTAWELYSVRYHVIICALNKLWHKIHYGLWKYQLDAFQLRLSVVVCWSCWNKNIFICLLQRLVVKPDQLIKRRGKLGLVGVNLDLNGAREWLKSRLMKETTVRNLHPSLWECALYWTLLQSTLSQCLSQILLLRPRFALMHLFCCVFLPDVCLPKQLLRLLRGSVSVHWW